MSAGEQVIEGVGLPVEIGRIDRELGRLWEDAGESRTRASLVNLVLYSEDPEALDENTRLVAEIAGRHACRAIVILAQPDAVESRARAWINAHCYAAGKRQICSEQITFHLEGESAAALPSIVFSHLDSDLPLCFWWQGLFHRPADARLWSWVDRALYDSGVWEEPAGQFEAVWELAASGDGVALCDLNWARVLATRFAVASLFDHSAALGALRRLDRVEIAHAPGCRTAALLLLGWVASRLGWKVQPMISSGFFLADAGAHVAFELTEAEGATVSRCSFFAGPGEFRVERCDAHFEATVRVAGSDEHPRLFGAGRETLPELLVSELSRGGRHGNYRRAVEAILPLL